MCCVIFGGVCVRFLNCLSVLQFAGLQVCFCGRLGLEHIGSVTKGTVFAVNFFIVFLVL